MAEQEQKKTTAPAEQPPETEQIGADRKASIADDLDDILDEIDEVLETNAEEFVKSYVQKGGE